MIKEPRTDPSSTTLFLPTALALPRASLVIVLAFHSPDLGPVDVLSHHQQAQVPTVRSDQPTNVSFCLPVA